MPKSGKIVIASQHYPPDPTTTAAIMAAVATRLTQQAPVVVLSGTARSASKGAADQPTVIEIRNWMPGKAALVRRTLAELWFTLHIFLKLVMTLRRGDVVLTVTAPFMLPYAVAAAAGARRARSVLILHDLYPDVLVMSGLLGSSSIVTKAIRVANTWMFRALSAVVIIGRDTEKLLLRYRGMTADKIHFIPNWASLAPGVRPIEADNPFRTAPGFVVGLSGNLGFTHDPVVVFEAARLLRNDPGIHFLLSGWGIGFERLRQMQAEARLPNVTLVERVAEEDLERFLAAADIWLIPYRKDVAGVSVPSRFYNLLAVGRPVVLVSEPEAEAALIVSERKLGFVVTPGKPDELAHAIRLAASSSDPSMAERAVAAAGEFRLDVAMAAYARLIEVLRRD